MAYHIAAMILLVNLMCLLWFVRFFFSICVLFFFFCVCFSQWSQRIWARPCGTQCRRIQCKTWRNPIFLLPISRQCQQLYPGNFIKTTTTTTKKHSLRSDFWFHMKKRGNLLYFLMVAHATFSIDIHFYFSFCQLQTEFPRFQDIFRFCMTFLPLELSVGVRVATDAAFKLKEKFVSKFDKEKCAFLKFV